MCTHDVVSLFRCSRRFAPICALIYMLLLGMLFPYPILVRSAVSTLSGNTRIGSESVVYDAVSTLSGNTRIGSESVVYDALLSRALGLPGSERIGSTTWYGTDEWCRKMRTLSSWQRS